MPTASASIASPAKNADGAARRRSVGSGDAADHAVDRRQDGDLARRLEARAGRRPVPAVASAEPAAVPTAATAAAPIASNTTTGSISGRADGGRTARHRRTG